MHEYIVALDIGSSNVYGAVGKIENQGNLHIVGTNAVDCLGVKKGIVVDIETTAKSIRECIDNLERIVDIKIPAVFLSLPGVICELISNRAVIAISSEDREIREKDVFRVLDAAKIISLQQDKEIVGVIPQQYIVDGYENISEPVGMSGLRLELDAQVIVAKSMVLNNLRKSLERANISIIAEVFSSQAVSNIALDNIDKNLSTLVIDVGGETTDLSLYRKRNLIFTSVIPLGGNNITKDISICLKIPHSTSEQVKIKYGQLKLSPEKDGNTITINDGYNNRSDIKKEILNSIIESRVEEILYLTKDKMVKNNFYEEISNIIIIGGGVSLFRDIAQYASNILGKSVEVGYPSDFGATNPKYSCVVGTIKDIYETLKMTKQSNSKENSKNDSTKKINSTVEEKSENILDRLKDFISDFF
ncbi:cell division protein FtsA [Clostridium sediminicola]|uniref:cell division protein FtsA n=1 Tax=Clostridium sediminicola TaxID=3114879 RepID=UPI0031F1FD63